MLKKDVEVGIILLERYSVVDNACHCRKEIVYEFFYMYTCLFTDLHVRFPFDEFTMVSSGS